MALPSRRLLLGALVAAVWVAGCSDRARRNPLDAGADEPQNDGVQALSALAGHGRVVLSWDFTRYADIAGYRLYRSRAGAPDASLTAAPLAPSTREWTDRDVVEGVTYEYRLALLVEEEGERPLEPRVRATPGPQLAWVADWIGGLVWKVAPDGRNAYFGRGRFPDMQGMALDVATGACWIADRYYAGLYRLDAEGEVHAHPAALPAPGALAVDPAWRRGWVTDRASGQVLWFPLPEAGDSLSLRAVDARFETPDHLAAADGGCWVSDPQAGRVLFYRPEGDRLEVGEVDRPAVLAAGPQGVWCLTAGGEGLLRLDRQGGRLAIGLPFAAAADLAVEPASGIVWVLSAESLARFSPEGQLLGRWDGLEEARSLAVDERTQEVWIGTRTSLVKLSGGLVVQARLLGFAGVLCIALDAGPTD